MRKSRGLFWTSTTFLSSFSVHMSVVVVSSHGDLYVVASPESTQSRHWQTRPKGIATLLWALPSCFRV